MPLFYQLFVFLRDAILGGVYQTGDRLPSESELCAGFGISRTTVRYAVDRLVSDGYVYRKHGKGTFVARPSPKMRLLLDPSWARAMRTRGITPEVRTLMTQRVQPPPAVRDQLKTSSETVFHIRNLVLGNGEPWIVSEQYIDTGLGLSEVDLTDTILADVLSEKMGIRISESVCLFLEPVLLGEADAALLDVSAASAGLHVARRVKDSLGRVVLYSESLFRGDRCKLLFSTV
ncbi:MAG: GntR family transcriptional regulator [Dehalococcoidia bacterium]